MISAEERIAGMTNVPGHLSSIMFLGVFSTLGPGIGAMSKEIWGLTGKFVSFAAEYVLFLGLETTLSLIVDGEVDITDAALSAFMMLAGLKLAGSLTKRNEKEKFTKEINGIGREFSKNAQDWQMYIKKLKDWKSEFLFCIVKKDGKNFFSLRNLKTKKTTYHEYIAPKETTAGNRLENSIKKKSERTFPNKGEVKKEKIDTDKFYSSDKGDHLFVLKDREKVCEANGAGKFKDADAFLSSDGRIIIDAIKWNRKNTAERKCLSAHERMHKAVCNSTILTDFMNFLVENSSKNPALKEKAEKYLKELGYKGLSEKEIWNEILAKYAEQRYLSSNMEEHVMPLELKDAIRDFIDGTSSGARYQEILDEVCYNIDNSIESDSYPMSAFRTKEVSITEIENCAKDIASSKTSKEAFDHAQKIYLQRSIIEKTIKGEGTSSKNKQKLQNSLNLAQQVYETPMSIVKTSTGELGIMWYNGKILPNSAYIVEAMRTGRKIYVSLKNPVIYQKGKVNEIIVEISFNPDGSKTWWTEKGENIVSIIEKDIRSTYKGLLPEGFSLSMKYDGWQGMNGVVAHDMVKMFENISPKITPETAAKIQEVLQSEYGLIYHHEILLKNSWISQGDKVQVVGHGVERVPWEAHGPKQKWVSHIGSAMFLRTLELRYFSTKDRLSSEALYLDRSSRSYERTTSEGKIEIFWNNKTDIYNKKNVDPDKPDISLALSNNILPLWKKTTNNGNKEYCWVLKNGKEFILFWYKIELGKIKTAWAGESSYGNVYDAYQNYKSWRQKQ